VERGKIIFIIVGTLFVLSMYKTPPSKTISTLVNSKVIDKYTKECGANHSTYYYIKVEYNGIKTSYESSRLYYLVNKGDILQVILEKTLDSKNKIIKQALIDKIDYGI
jgi:hypothetical protein